MTSGANSKHEPVINDLGQQTRWKELEDKRSLLDGRLHDTIKRGFYTFLVFLVLIAFVSFMLMYSQISVKNKCFVLIVILISLIGFAIYIIIKQAECRTIREEMRGLDFRIDLAKEDFDPIERRALKILDIYQYQIKQYHDFNLRQNKMIFLLGLFCVCAGIIVVLLTFAVVIFWAKDLHDKVIISVVGAIGSILSNFVGTIYLVMHKSAANALSIFYVKLIDSHRMFVGNLIASRISVKQKREDVFAKLAYEIMEEHPEDGLDKTSSN